MAKKILLINKNAVLIAGRLIQLLESSDIKCVNVEPKAEKLRREKDNADAFMFITGQFVYKDKDFLMYLKDVCANDEKPLCVMGYEEEIEAVEQIIPKNMIVRKFVRPADINTLFNTLKMILSSDWTEEKKEILLVDDDITFLKMMQNWLETKYQVAAARSGMQALNYLAEYSVDLILLDYDMPLIDGAKVLEMIRSKPKIANIPVIFLTGKNDVDSVKNVMGLKPARYLLKTNNKENILQSLDNFFNNH